MVKFKSVLLIFVLFYFSSCQKRINTVNGSTKASDLGFVLTHEHIMSNFGKEIDETSLYDSTKLYAQVIPYLQKLKSMGVNTVFDCTTAYFGRRIDLLQVISARSGVKIITNTGFYGAAGDKYIPPFAYSSSSEQIANIWIDEFKNGIESSRIKPGFIKMAFDDDMPPSAIDKKLFEAGMLTHLKTGLTMAVHTGKNLKAVTLQLQMMSENNIHPGAWIWTHANKLDDDEMLIAYAKKGAWISLDGVNETNISEYIRRIKLFKEKNLLHKILLSHDGNGFPKGGEIRQFHAIFENLIPEMLKAGFSQKDIEQLLINNPKEAFTIRVRRS